MGLTSALNTSLNGLSLNETSIDVLGNNIANAGTNGFKTSAVRFATQLSRTLSVGSRPSATSGGTNPRQVGLGASVAVISRDFSQGSTSNSTSASDLAIQGDGFFVLSGSSGRVYSRNGNFSRNSDANLVNDQGMLVQGYAVDQDFNLITTQLSNLQIPVGDLNVAQRTTEITMSGALLPTGDLGTQGSFITSEALIMVGTPDAPILTDPLVDVRTAANPLVPMFADGDVLSFQPRKGGRTLDAGSLVVTAFTTVGDYLQFLDDALGIQSGGFPTDPNGGGQPGVTISAAGVISIVGNSGSINDIDLAVGDLLSDGVVVPLSFTKTADAIGESTGTDFVVYDSLGQPVNVRMTAVLESRVPGETTYRWYIESTDDSGTDIAIENGELTFDSQGNVSGDAMPTFQLDRSSTAAVSPMQITLDLSQISGISTVAAGSRLNLAAQDGTPPGTLQSFVIDESGIINGIFDNGSIRTLGQVLLARFANPDGLVEDGSTSYKEGVSSGSPVLTPPGTAGVGTIRAGAIELSNTDIGKNLVDLIVASTNYRGNARVISSVQQLVDELLVLGR